MNARVTKFLNIRTGDPQIQVDNNPGFYQPNEVVTIVDTVIGEDYKGNNIWHKVADGGFVWNGGLEENLLTKALDWWHEAYGITDVWKTLGTWGEKSKIAVIDSGVDLTHPFLDKNLITARNADASNPDFSDEDGHGTSVAGIIAGNRIRYFGTAPMCRIHVIKATSTATMTGAQLMTALHAVASDVDIVNISQRIPHNDALKSSLRAFFNAHPETIFVCAAGNNGIANVINNLPASLSGECRNVISVASVNRAGNVSSFASCKSDFLTLAAPGEEIQYLNKWDPAKTYTGAGTSYAAPIVAGLIALAKSYLKNKDSHTTAGNILSMLKETVTKREPPEVQLYGLGVVDPRTFANKIKSI